jgi:hypothetical protein
MLSVAVKSITLSVVMLSVVVLSVIMLNVVAPVNISKRNLAFQIYLKNVKTLTSGSSFLWPML